MKIRYKLHIFQFGGESRRYKPFFLAYSEARDVEDYFNEQRKQPAKQTHHDAQEAWNTFDWQEDAVQNHPKKTSKKAFPFQF